jgi:hypothetical protein
MMTTHNLSQSLIMCATALLSNQMVPEESEIVNLEQSMMLDQQLEVLKSRECSEHTR